MSEAPDLSETEALAAEHALGVLGSRERAEAEARMAREPVFAQAVEAWRARLAPLLDSVAAVPAPAGVWPRVERALPANDNASGRGLRFWRGATVGSLGLAAASLAAAVMLANRPPVVVQPPAPGAILNASLNSTTGAQPLFVAAYDPDRKALIITSLVPPTGDPLHVHELWLIPKDGKPRSLGLVAPGVSKAMPMPQTLDQMVAEGAALAVSVEPPGGSSSPEGPSGPIAAMGKLAKI
ncbi:anti-sigma factor domain-containing protein [Phenylobacterium sp.]|uniref:anti-sigma factor n=1 Tax=Phenylobacterium sp. TaxID=1871053 RepID=UPI003983BEF5